MKQHTSQFLRKRKLMLFLPVLALPFITLLFWSLKSKGAQANGKPTTLQGLNTQLPGAQLDAQKNDKLSLYQQALKDSEQLAQERQQDPYSLDTERESVYEAGDVYTADSYEEEDPDRNVRRVQERLDALQRNLRSPQAFQEAPYDYTPPPDDGPEMASLNNAMQQIQNLQSGTAATGDPDIDKINGMLQKVIDIQHPEQARERMETRSYKNKGIVYAVNEPEEHMVDLLRPENLLATAEDSAAVKRPGRTAFYELGNTNEKSPGDNKATPAVVNESQTLVNGATLKMRLSEGILINGVRMPKGAFVFGSCRLEGERLMVNISNIRYGKRLFPVALSVYDLDGLAGIRIPGAITRDAVKEGADRGIQSVNLMSMDPSLGAQAAAAGIEATRSLLSKKVKLVRVTVKAGYPVLLFDEHKRDNNY